MIGMGEILETGGTSGILETEETSGILELEIEGMSGIQGGMTVSLAVGRRIPIGLGMKGRILIDLEMRIGFGGQKMIGADVEINV